ncbi:MAG: hypothetical protein HY874_01140 [Chloroflexi bacterium]|nr:hypothetical protein [Chloroflexota bacterium]
MTHRFLRGLLLALAVVATFTMSHRRAQAAEPSLISVSPATASAHTGEDVPLDINAANVPAQPGLGGYLIVLTWDPAVLTLTSLTDSGWVTSGQVIVVCTTPTIDNAAGTAEIDCSPVIGFGAGVSTDGPHVLAQAVFQAKTPGTTSLALTDSVLLNTSGLAMTSTLAGGSVTVAAAPTPTASPSPEATPTSEATSTPATPQPTSTAAAPATPASISPAPSTKPAGETLSKVEVPRTGSGTPAGAEDSGFAWWTPALTAAGAVLLATGGFAAFRRANRRTRNG